MVWSDMGGRRVLWYWLSVLIDVRDILVLEIDAAAGSVARWYGEQDRLLALVASVFAVIVVVAALQTPLVEEPADEPDQYQQEDHAQCEDQRYQTVLADDHDRWHRLAVGTGSLDGLALVGGDQRDRHAHLVLGVRHEVLNQVAVRGVVQRPAVRDRLAVLLLVCNRVVVHLELVTDVPVHKDFVHITVLHAHFEDHRILIGQTWRHVS